MVHSLQNFPGIGPKRLAILREAGLATAEDLVQWAPRDWIDRTRLMRIDQVRPDVNALIRGEVVSAKTLPGKRQRLVVKLRDRSGSIELLFFNFISGWQQRMVVGSEWVASGKVSWYRHPQIVHPELEEVQPDEEWEGGILAIYPLTEKMRGARMEQRFLRNAMAHALKLPALKLQERLPETLRNELDFLPELENYRRLHQPANMDQVAQGLRQLRWSELLPVAIRMAHRRKLMLRRGHAWLGGDELAKQVEEEFPFQLTAGQQEAIKKIIGGIKEERQSHFLLQGDVGSGKSAVAMIAAAAVIGAGGQVALMAPTEILAWQHLQTFLPLCKRVGIWVSFLSGATTPQERRLILNDLEEGRVQLLIGTHTLFSADVKFKKLALCIIDEQHRFGVGQRAALLAKGVDPDLLALSATPIPRSLAMTLYGDLQPVVLSEKPPGRQPIQTRLVPEKKRKEMLLWLDRQFAFGARAYWVVPRIDESEESELLSLEKLYSELKKIRPHWKIEQVHGRLPEETKLSALDKFAKGEAQLLVATTVIEVGVNVPQATIMVIDGAERFGLAQLHQLRGRVGRGGDESWCFLLVPTIEEANERLRGFAATEDGFAIAELDLEQRGAGNLEGLVQSGMAQFRWFDFVRDRDLIQQSAEYAASRMELWERLPEDQKEAYLAWVSEDQLNAAGNQ